MSGSIGSKPEQPGSRSAEFVPLENKTKFNKRNVKREVATIYPPKKIYIHAIFLCVPAKESLASNPGLD
jgi:hypothetical protein